MTELSPLGVARHLATWGLPGGPTGRLEVPAGAWAGLPAIVDLHQITGPVLSAVQGGAVTDVPDAVVEDLTQRHAAGLRSALLTEADLVIVGRRLLAHGIEFRVLKGGATAHLDHEDPALRRTSDVDLLVMPDELAFATTVLEPLVDRRRTVPDRRASWTERYGKDRTLALASGGWLDLHRSLVPGYHGLVDRHDWFANGELFSIAETALSAMGRTDRFVHAVAHAGFADHVRFHSVRDVPLLLGMIDDWRTVLDRHPEWSGLLARGVRTTWAALELHHHPIVDWAASVRPTVRERVALRTFDLQGSRQHWGAALAVPPHRWPALFGPLTVPSREYLAYYGRSPVEHVRSTVTRVLRPGRRG